MILFLFLTSLVGGSYSADIKQEETHPVVLEPLERTEVYPEVYTRVVEINKKLGDSFKKGDLILQMDNEVFKAVLEKAVQARLKAEKELQVKSSLFQEKLVSELELKDAELALASAKADESLAKKNLESAAVVADYSGKVATIYVRLWEVPQRDKPMIELVDDSKLVAKLFVPSDRLQQVAPGNVIYIYVKELGEITQATITRTGAVINPASSTVKIEAEIDNRRGKWKSGMSGQAALNREALERL